MRDLYVVYKENDLSEEVREAVKQHLEGCEDCRNIYESESNFSDILKKEPDKQPPEKLDEKLMLRLKVSRLRAAVLFVASILLVILYSSYSQSRKNLLYDMSFAEKNLHDISFKIDDILNDKGPIISFSGEIDILNNQQNAAIMRDLNIIEKSQVKKFPNGLFMNFEVDHLYGTLKTRHMNGTFSDRDEKAYSLLKNYMKDITKVMSDERLKFNEEGKLQTLIRPVNIKAAAEDYKNLNELALMYMQYDKLPGELAPMSEAELKARLKSIFNLDNPDINFYNNIKPSIALNGDCSFDIKQGSQRYNGDIDAYTGNIKRLMSNGPDKTGELLPLEGVKADLQTFLERIYGKDQRFYFQYDGINYNFSSNTDLKVYSFKISPVINGLKVYDSIYVYCNARTGDISDLDIRGNDFLKPDYPIDTFARVSPSEGFKNLDIIDKEKYSYSETVIIKSQLSGKYVTVYLYKNGTDSVFVNMATGKQEFIN